jgi:hypothetical protein
MCVHAEKCLSLGASERARVKQCKNSESSEAHTQTQQQPTKMNEKIFNCAHFS